MRSALTKALKSYGELTNKRKVNKITAEDVCDGVIIILSLFIPNPQFQGQTKERLSMPEAARLVESQIKDHFDLFLSSDTNAAEELLEWISDRRPLGDGVLFNTFRNRYTFKSFKLENMNAIQNIEFNTYREEREGEVSAEEDGTFVLDIPAGTITTPDGFTLEE